MSLSTVSKKVESDKKTENAGKTNRTELSAGKAVVNESGIEIKTLYTAEDVKRSGVVDRSLPGEHPFTRGIHAEMYVNVHGQCVNIQDSQMLQIQTSVFII